MSYKGEYHYRSGSTKQELKGAALDKFLLRKQGKHWDGVPVPKVSAKDFRPGAVTQFRKLAGKSQRLSSEVLLEPDAALLEKLHLTEGEYLKRAAVLLFHPDPEQCATGAYIKIGYFENNVDLRYQDEVHGDLFAQANQTLDLLQTKYLKALITYSGLQRTEAYPVPEGALREAILNAIVHKDYSSGVPTQISVYPDKLMIWNPGQLPPDWTVERLLSKHASQPFNPDVANAFFRAGMIESWGRRIERIFEACRVAGTPEPVLDYEPSGLWITFPFSPAHVAVMSGGLDETSGKLGEKLGENRDKIISRMRTDPKVTVTELAQHLGISTTAVEKNLKLLKEQGHIQRVGPAKGGRWEVLK